MKNFRFTLEIFLKVKNEELKECQRILAKKKEEIEEKKEEIDGIEGSESHLQEEMGERRKKGDFFGQSHYEETIDHLRKNLEVQEREKREKEKEQKYFQKETQIKLAKAKTLEKLKERQYALWKKEQEKIDERRI